MSEGHEFTRGYEQAYAEICGAAPVVTTTSRFRELAVASDFWAIRNGKTQHDTICHSSCCGTPQATVEYENAYEVGPNVIKGHTRSSAVSRLTHWRTERGWFRRQRASERSRYIPIAIRREVIERDDSVCAYCGTTESLSLDHIHPWSEGGSHDATNLQVLCRSCNSTKGAKTDYVPPPVLVGATA